MGGVQASDPYGGNRTEAVQKGNLREVQKKYGLEEMEGDHIKPWHEGGKTNAANCQMLCKDDNRRKSGR